MSTVNISLPKEQLDFIDSLVDRFNFANRSEFIRSLLRLIRYKPDLITKTATFPFVAPCEKSINKIMSGFKESKLYSEPFLKDLKEGLKQSNYFRR